jgi:hypothetical protein
MTKTRSRIFVGAFLYVEPTLMLADGRLQYIVRYGNKNILISSVYTIKKELPL